MANLTLNKYRKAQALIEEAETRADSAEKNLQSVRRARSMSVTREITRVVKVRQNSEPDQTDKLTFDCQKIAKNLTFF